MRSYLFISLTLLLALVLAVMPLPALVDPFRPDWVLLIVTYWCIALPHRVSVGTGWVCGFLLDILLGSVLGTHALILALVVYICSANYLTIRNFSVWQQSLIIGMVAAFYHLVDYWLQHFLTTAFFMPELLWPIATNTLIWTGIFYSMRRYRRAFRIR